MGRPTFNIDQQRLRGLREEAGKTQLAVARELHAKLGGRTHPSDATLLSDYQRIERTGRTSRQRAQALAEIFQVTVAVLQGNEAPEPIDYLARLASLLREQLSTGANQALVRALQQSADTSELSDESIRFLAEDVGERIEAAQLGRNPDELAQLVALTGLPESELLKPANVNGYWLVIASGIGIHSIELIRGASGLAWHVRDIVGDRLDSHGSDGSIRMYRDEPWFRMEIRPSWHPDLPIRIDFVRCAPSDGKGVSWARATWRERFVFEDDLRSWAYSAANFVADFEGVQSPTGDVRHLRLLVTEYGGLTNPTMGRLVISGRLDEISDQTMDGFRRDRSTHHLVLNWLTNDLKWSLAPYFAAHPRQCWSVRSGDQVVIELDEHKARNRPLQDCHFGPKYRITLVEEVGANQFRPVPWRNKDVEQLRENILRMLDESDGHPYVTDEPRRSFDPYVAEE